MPVARRAADALAAAFTLERSGVFLRGELACPYSRSGSAWPAADLALRAGAVAGIRLSPRKFSSPAPLEQDRIKDNLRALVVFAQVCPVCDSRHDVIGDIRSANLDLRPAHCGGIVVDQQPHFDTSMVVPQSSTSGLGVVMRSPDSRTWPRHVYSQNSGARYTVYGLASTPLGLQPTGLTVNSDERTLISWLEQENLTFERGRIGAAAEHDDRPGERQRNSWCHLDSELQRTEILRIAAKPTLRRPCSITMPLFNQLHARFISPKTPRPML